MLAKRENLDILQKNQLIMSLIENRIVDNILDVLLIPLREEQHSLRISLWGPEKTLTIGVLTKTLENCANSSRNLCLTLQRLLL